MTEQKLREMFKNKSNCYADSDDVVQAIDEDMFVTLVSKILGLSHNKRSTPLRQLCGGCGRMLTAQFYCNVCDNDV